MRHLGLDRTSCNQQENGGMKADAIHSLKCIIMFKVWCVSVRPYPTLCKSKVCSPPGSSVDGISQGRMLECFAIFLSRGSSRYREWTCVSCVSSTGRRILYHLCWDAVIENSQERIQVTDSVWWQLLLSWVRRLQTEQGEMERGISI